MFFAAGIEFTREGQASAALLAVGLLGWAVVAESLAWQTTWSGPAVDESGYGTGLTQSSVDYLAQLDRFAGASHFLAVGLGVFGPLLFVWSLIL